MRHSDELRGFVEAFVQGGPALEELEADPTIEGAAKLLANIQAMRSQLALAEGAAKEFLIDTLPGGVYTVEGVPGIAGLQRTTSVKRSNWRDAELISAIRRAKGDERIANASTGEVEGEGEAMTRLIVEAARLTWRTTPLKKWGIQVDEFCDVQPDAPSLRIF